MLKSSCHVNEILWMKSMTQNQTMYNYVVIDPFACF